MDMDQGDPPTRTPTSGVPGSPGTPPLPAPPTPSGTSWSEGASPLDGSPPSEPRSPWRRRAIIAIVCAGVLLVVLTTLMLHRGDGLPESIAGFPRIHSDQVRAIEEALAHTEVAGVTFQVAMYGNAETPTLILERFNGVPDVYVNATSEQIFDDSVRGFEATSYATADAEGKVTRTIDAVSYTCASIRPESASQPTLTGSLCVWKGDDLGILVTLRTTDPTAAIDDVHSAYESLH